MTRIPFDPDAIRVLAAILAETGLSEIEIAAPPSRVFRALIEREQALQWGSNDSFQVNDWHMDARVGGKWSFVSRECKSRDHAGLDYEHHGEILEFDPPRRLVYTWFANWHELPSHQTMVRWDLTPTTNGTHVKVTHTGLAALASARKGYAEGWTSLLRAIRNHVEKH